MRLPKPLRVTLYGLVTGAVLTGGFLLLAPLLGFWAFGVFLLLPLANVITGLALDAVDLWLRKRSRDPQWLMSPEGQIWLGTDEGREWLVSEKGEQWRGRTSSPG